MLLFMNMGKRLKTHKDTILNLLVILPEYKNGLSDYLQNSIMHILIVWYVSMIIILFFYQQFKN
jgi:hypothetical protein